MRPLKDHLLAIAVIAALLVGPGFVNASEPAGEMFDERIASGLNFQVAEFRLWLPGVPGPLRGALVLVPGSNSDGRPMAHDPAWQAFAAKKRLAIIACRFTDRPHDKDFIEEPALFFVGEQDLAARTDVIKGLFAINRRAGALWALVAEPDVGHDEGRSREVSLLFFEDVLPLRLGSPGSPLRSMDESSGFVTDLATSHGEQLRERSPPDHLTSWLPTERVARACQSIN